MRWSIPLERYFLPVCDRDKKFGRRRDSRYTGWLIALCNSSGSESGKWKEFSLVKWCSANVPENRERCMGSLGAAHLRLMSVIKPITEHRSRVPSAYFDGARWTLMSDLDQQWESCRTCATIITVFAHSVTLMVSVPPCKPWTCTSKNLVRAWQRSKSIYLNSSRKFDRYFFLHFSALSLSLFIFPSFKIFTRTVSGVFHIGGKYDRV